MLDQDRAAASEDASSPRLNRKIRRIERERLFGNRTIECDDGDQRLEHDEITGERPLRVVAKYTPGRVCMSSILFKSQMSIRMLRGCAPAIDVHP